MTAEREARPLDEVPALTADVNQLAELATSLVTIELHSRFAAFTDEYLAQADGTASANE